MVLDAGLGAHQYIFSAEIQTKICLKCVFFGNTMKIAEASSVGLWRLGGSTHCYSCLLLQLNKSNHIANTAFVSSTHLHLVFTFNYAVLLARTQNIFAPGAGYPKGPSRKDIHSQGEFFRCGRPHLFAQKTSDFSKFMYGVSARTRGGVVS